MQAAITPEEKEFQESFRNYKYSFCWDETLELMEMYL